MSLAELGEASRADFAAAGRPRGWFCGRVAPRALAAGVAEGFPGKSCRGYMFLFAAKKEHATHPALQWRNLTQMPAAKTEPPKPRPAKPPKQNRRTRLIAKAGSLW